MHPKGYGMAKVFRTVARDGGAEHWVTDDLKMSQESREELELREWGIETYHRGIKQCCGIERAQVRSGEAQRNHLGFALRAFLRLEAHKLLEDLTAAVVDGGLVPYRGAVACQLINGRIRLVEVERRVKETEELEERLERNRGSGGVTRWGG